MLIVTCGAYSTKSLILTDFGSDSVSCIASQVIFLLWWLFLTVNFNVDMAVIRLVFSIGSVSDVIPSVIWVPSPSFQVNWNKKYIIFILLTYVTYSHKSVINVKRGYLLSFQFNEISSNNVKLRLSWKNLSFKTLKLWKTKT